MNERRNSVVIYENWHEFLKTLGPEKYIEGIELIMAYALDGTPPTTDDPVLFAFMWGVMPIIDTNNKKYYASKKKRKKEDKKDENIPTN